MADSIGSEFIEKTKFQYSTPSDQMRGLPQPPLELGYDIKKPLIDLPLPKDIAVKDVGLREAIERRKSVRDYADIPLGLSELSFLLWSTQGVKEVFPGQAIFRTVPSAGARHSFETYLLVNNVKELCSGIYRFLSIDHKLVEENIKEGVADKIVEGCLGQEFVKTCAVVFIWTVVACRMKWRYGERGYRYMFLDAGHVCQNLYLAGEAIDCGVCAVAAFADDRINSVLGIDGNEQFSIYIATVGKKGE